MHWFEVEIAYFLKENNENEVGCLLPLSLMVVKIRVQSVGLSHREFKTQTGISDSRLWLLTLTLPTTTLLQVVTLIASNDGEHLANVLDAPLIPEYLPEPRISSRPRLLRA